ncbi:hypothetical protein [Candidatus Poriferisodalis sp.]|uniref:hypothetical protein n=1 Tax=Candidatus Poriferisodalis sp. TaxID=3101277 RepID=UPI003B02389F
MSNQKLDEMVEAIKRIGAEGKQYEVQEDRFDAGPVRIVFTSTDRPASGRDPIPYAAYLSYPVAADVCPPPNLRRFTPADLAKWADDRIVKGCLTDGRVDPNKCSHDGCLLAQEVADYFRTL